MLEERKGKLMKQKGENEENKLMNEGIREQSNK